MASPELSLPAPDPGQLAELARTQAYTLGRPFHVRLTPDGRTALFLRASGTDPVADLYAFSRDDKALSRILSATELLGGKEESLSEADRALRERRRIKTAGFTSFAMGKSGRLLLKLDGRLFSFDPARERPVEWVVPGGEVTNPRLDPTEKRVAFVRGGRVEVADLPEPSDAAAVELAPRPLDDGSKANGSARQDVTRGLAEFVAQEEMHRFEGYWWSPDGSTILYQENDETQVEKFTIADAARPERPASTFPYPRPGRKNVDVRLFFAPVDGGPRRELTWDRETYPYLAKVSWTGPLLLIVQARDQRRQALMRVGPDGEARPLFEERDENWLNLHPSNPRVSSDGKSFLWANEEGGSWRLERKWLADDGRSVVRRQVIVPERAGFVDITHVDERRGWVWFSGGADPAALGLYRARLDGSETPEEIVGETAWSDAHFAKNGEALALTTTSLESLPETRLARLTDRGLEFEGSLPHEAETPKRRPDVELIPAKEAGGFRAAIVRPAGFDPKKRYPVLLYVYGGPGHSLVKATMSSWFLPQWIADHGFVVVSLDGRGTPRRGKSFERAIKNRFHEVPLEDQVKGFEALAKSRPYLDRNRVGVYGWSFGGYMAALAVLKRPDLFKAAISGAPVTDWWYYDTHYTERYLGVPEGNNDPVYAATSLVRLADRLERPLLLVHGIADDNVYFAHSLQLAEALFRAGKPFELLPLVGGTHQLSDAGAREALYGRIVAFLRAHL